jgi:hypothetical protein
MRLMKHFKVPFINQNIKFLSFSRNASGAEARYRIFRKKME